MKKWHQKPSEIGCRKPRLQFFLRLSEICLRAARRSWSGQELIFPTVKSHGLKTNCPTDMLFTWGQMYSPSAEYFCWTVWAHQNVSSSLSNHCRVIQICCCVLDLEVTGNGLLCSVIQQSDISDTYREIFEFIKRGPSSNNSDRISGSADKWFCLYGTYFKFWTAVRCLTGNCARQEDRISRLWSDDEKCVTATR